MVLHRDRDFGGEPRLWSSFENGKGDDSTFSVPESTREYAM